MCLFLMYLAFHEFTCPFVAKGYTHIYAGSPLVVKTDILVRSMGPICERDMVSFTCYHFSNACRTSMGKLKPNTNFESCINSGQLIILAFTP